MEQIDDLIAGNISAHGGLARLKAVETKRFRGMLTSRHGSGTLLLEQKRPAKFRAETVIEGRKYVHATDGVQAWQYDESAGVARLYGDEKANLALDADFDGALVDYGAKGSRATYSGRVEIEGISTYRLKLRLKDGNVLSYYLDPETFLEKKWEGGRDIGGREVIFESYFRDYRATGGLTIAHRIDTGSKEMGEPQSLSYDRVELNIPIDDSRFAMPRHDLQTL